MINRKIILSSVIAGVVSLSASHHVTAARTPVKLSHHFAMKVLHIMPHENVTVNDQDTGEIGTVKPIEILSNFVQISRKYGGVIADNRINTFPIKKLDDKNKFPNMNTQVFYGQNDFRLPTCKGNTDSKISQAGFEYPMDYDDVKRIVAIDGQHYNTMKFKNVSMDLNDALAIPLGAKGGQYALHYSFDTIHNINRFYLDKNENQEILIKHLNFGDLTDLKGIDLSRFSHILPSFGVRLGSEYGSYAALSFTNIEFMDLPAGVNYIPNNTFNHSSIIFLGNTNKIEHIGYCAFEGTRITEMDLTNCCTLDSSSFAFCKVLKKVIFGSKLKTIPNYCFYKCETLGQEDNGILNLTNVDVLEDFCFAECPEIQKVFLSDRLINKVPEHAFDAGVVISYVDANGKMVAQ